MFSSKSFIVSGLTFRSLIHFEFISVYGVRNEKLLLHHENMPGFLVSRGEELDLWPETRLDCSELLCNKVLLKYKGDRESF